MSQQQLGIDEGITASELPKYIPGQPLISSVHMAWSGIFIRKFSQIHDEVIIPGLSDIGIAIQLSRAVDLERKLAGSLHKSRVHPGDITIVPKEAPTAWRLAKPADVLHVHVQPLLMTQIANEIIDIDPGRIEIIDRLGVRDPLIHQIGLLLLAELQAGGIAGRLYAESLGHSLALHLVRYHSALWCPTARAAAGLPPRKLQRVLEYINAHLDQDIALADLAEVVDLSAYHFTREFKRSLGLAPHQYLIERRIEAAKHLLVETHLSLADIAYQVGISSQSHFTTLFRKRVGITPAAYRHMLS